MDNDSRFVPYPIQWSSSPELDATYALVGSNHIPEINIPKTGEITPISGTPTNSLLLWPAASLSTTYPMCSVGMDGSSPVMFMALDRIERDLTGEGHSHVLTKARA